MSAQRLGSSLRLTGSATRLTPYGTPLRSTRDGFRSMVRIEQNGDIQEDSRGLFIRKTPKGNSSKGVPFTIIGSSTNQEVQVGSFQRPTPSPEALKATKQTVKVSLFLFAECAIKAFFLIVTSALKSAKATICPKKWANSVSEATMSHPQFPLRVTITVFCRKNSSGSMNGASQTEFLLFKSLETL